MTSTPQENPVIERALSKASRIATLPEITGRILELLDNPGTTAGQLEALVSRDPVLSAKVLKVVNSSFYGLPAKVGSIRQAIVMIGLGGIRNIALAASLAKLFGGMSPQGTFDPQGPWQHSAAVAAAAKMLAEQLAMDSDEMFLAGLLHDVGTVIALQAMRREFFSLVEQRCAQPDESWELAERRVLGATHEEFGVALCSRWNFPKSIQAAVAFHHKPAECALEFRRAAQIICAADHLAADSNIGYCSTAHGDEIPEDVVTALGLSDDMLAGVRAHLSEASDIATQMTA